MNQPTPNQFERVQIVWLLARSLGDEKARAVWDEALQKLKIPPAESFTPAVARQLLESLSSTGGIVGVAARFTLVRLGQSDGSSPRPPSKASTDRLQAVRPNLVGGAPSTATSPRTQGSVYAYLLELFAPAFGEVKAAELLVQQSSHLGLDARTLTAEDGLTLLEALRAAGGLGAVVANFARVKFKVRYPG